MIHRFVWVSSAKTALAVASHEYKHEFRMLWTVMQFALDRVLLLLFKKFTCNSLLRFFFL